MTTQNRVVSDGTHGYKRLQSSFHQLLTSTMAFIKKAGQIHSDKAGVSKLDKVSALYSDL